MFGKLKSDYAADFPQLIHRCNFNRRRKTLGRYLQQLNQHLSNQLKGYSAVNKAWYFGYKLHLVTSAAGVFYSMDLSKASVPDVHYLNDIKYSGLNSCTLIGNKGYLSKTYKTDLFSTAKIELKTPMRSNQQHKKTAATIFTRMRKRIETLFAQLCDQFMLKRNYAKSAAGLSIRV